MIKKIFTSIFILSFLVLPLFCCCAQQASAATVGINCCDDKQDAYSEKQDQSEHHSHSCDCSHSLSVSFEKTSAFQIDLPSGQNLFAASTVQSFSVTALKNSMHLAYLGPPGRAFEVPLYIQQHSLRI